MSDSNLTSPTDNVGLQRLLAALDEFRENGKSTVECDECHEKWRFTQTTTAYHGQLRARVVNSPNSRAVALCDK